MLWLGRYLTESSPTLENVAKVTASLARRINTEKCVSARGSWLGFWSVGVSRQLSVCFLPVLAMQKVEGSSPFTLL